MGLIGERDIEKKVLDLPFPLYDANQASHRKLAALSNTAREATSAFLRTETLPASLARRRGGVRAHLRDILNEIDAIVATLL